MDSINRDWSLGKKDSFTTPGGFRAPQAEPARRYAYSRHETPAAAERPAPAAPDVQPRPWYAQAEAPETPVQAVIQSHDGEAQAARVLQSMGAQGPVYTIQLPPQPKTPAPKPRRLWWVPLALIAALLLGALGGAAAYPLLKGQNSVSPIQPAPGENPATRIYAENVDAVVSIHAAGLVPGASGGETAISSAGTGFLLTEDGYILTNYHVVRDAAALLVTLSDGQQLRGRLVAGEDQDSDLALLKIEATGLQTVTLGDSEQLQVGDRVYAIGNPLGELSNSLSAGYISAGPRRIRAGGVSITMLQTDAAINKGSSGGPLFDEAGRVVAVVTAKYAATEADATLEGLGFAIPINDALSLALDWIEADRGNGN